MLPISPLPTLKALEAARVPKQALEAMQELADRTGDERLIVVIFLYLYATSREGSVLERHKRVEIIKTYKQLKPDAELVQQVRLIVSEQIGLHLS